MYIVHEQYVENVFGNVCNVIRACQDLLPDLLNSVKLYREVRHICIVERSGHDSETERKSYLRK